MDANIDSLKLKIETYKDKINEICQKPSSKYTSRLSKIEENTTTQLMKTIEDIENVFYNPEVKGTVYILYTNSIKDLFIHFFNNGIQGLVKTSCRNINFQEMILSNKDKYIVINSLNEEGVTDPDKNFETQEIYNHYYEVKNKLYNQCFSRNYISYYSNDVKSMLNHYTRANIVGSFGTYTDDDNFIELDKNKCYTSILQNMKFIPYVNEFSHFTDLIIRLLLTIIFISSKR
jgi:hypothetical protein